MFRNSGPRPKTGCSRNCRGKALRTPVSLIYHSLDDVNEKLRLGRYFFIDILRDGILLFEEPGFPFAEPQPLSPQQALERRGHSSKNGSKARTSSRQYGTHAIFAGGHEKCSVRSPPSHGAALPLPVPGAHALQPQDPQSEPPRHSPRIWSRPEIGLAAATPSSNDAAYELLREAYVKARYSRHYHITAEQLQWLSGRIDLLRQAVRQVSEERIALLAEAA